MNIRALFITVIGFIIALLSGICLATENYEFFVWLPVVGLIMVSLTLQDKFWLIIPATTFVGGQLAFIPGQLNVHQLSILLAFVFFWVLVMFRKIQWRIKFGLPEFLACLFLIIVVQSYLRNPTGLNVLGSTNIGGKVYVHIIIGILAFVVLAWMKIPIRHLQLARKLALIFGWLEFFTLLGARISNGFFNIGRHIYTSASWYSVDPRAYIDSRDATREAFAVKGADIAARQSASLGNPLQAFGVKILQYSNIRWQFILTILALLFALLSGYRNVIANIGMLLAIGSIYYGGKAAFFKGLAFALACYIALLSCNAVFELPANVQRTLSFLPGNWQERYVNDTNNSSEWRFEIWKEVLLTDRWIENKFLGDGPGFNAAQASASSRGKLAGFDTHRSTILINGDYHSGPVSFIRNVGYVGLILYLFIIICIAFRAHKIIIKVRRCNYSQLYLFWLLPFIVSPIFFAFIFGDFKDDAPLLFINLGFLALLERNLPTDLQS